MNFRPVENWPSIIAETIARHETTYTQQGSGWFARCRCGGSAVVDSREQCSSWCQKHWGEVCFAALVWDKEESMAEIIAKFNSAEFSKPCGQILAGFHERLKKFVAHGRVNSSGQVQDMLDELDGFLGELK